MADCEGAAWVNNGPPIEPTSRHGAAASNASTTMKLSDVDGALMPPAAVYKSMSMDIIEGHQIGLYNGDGTIKYPHHHSLQGGDAAVAAIDPSGKRGLVGITRKRPWSANPTGRTMSPAAVRDVMKNDDIDGARPSYFRRTRQESDNLNVSDLDQKRRSPSPRRVDPHAAPRNGQDVSPFDAYNAFHKHTSMHRPKDQSGVVRQRPWSAGVAGRAPYSDPLDPVYYVAAPSAVCPKASASEQSSGALVRDLLQRNDQPSAARRCHSPDPAVIPEAAAADAVCSGRVIVSRPIHTKAAPMTRKGAGTFKSHIEADRAKYLLVEESENTAVVWDKLQDTKPVNNRLNSTKIRHHMLRDLREASARECQASADSNVSLADSAPLSPPTANTVAYPSSHVNPHMDYRDVPFATSAWKLRLLESRAQRKEQQRSAQELQELREATALREQQARPRYSSPPNCVDFGPSACSTTTTHYTAFTKAHNDACDDAATKGASPKRRVPEEPRRMPDGQFVGVEQCSDIYGTGSDSSWKRPATASSLMSRVHRDVAAAKQLSQSECSHSQLLTGSPSKRERGRASPPKRQVHAQRRPSSATVRSAPGADQKESTPYHPAVRSHGGKNEISAFAAAMQRSGMSFSKGEAAPSTSKRPQSAQPTKAPRIVARPPTHAANRKELLYRIEVASVRHLPNFV